MAKVSMLLAYSYRNVSYIHVLYHCAVYLNNLHKL